MTFRLTYPESDIITGQLYGPAGAANTPGPGQLAKGVDVKDSSPPLGYCQCGCGERTVLATRNDYRRGQIKGEPKRYVPGHRQRTTRVPTPAEYRASWKEATAAPFGRCWCGCGGVTPVADANNSYWGVVKGQPRRFMPSHTSRRHAGRRWAASDRGYDTPCWIWQGSITGAGYGQFVEDGRTVSAHRHNYETAKGPIPDGLQIDHLCRVRACVNPDHLEAVTLTENVRRGEAATLVLWQVRAMRRAAEEVGLTAAELGRAFRVSESAAKSILQGANWRGV